MEEFVILIDKEDNPIGTMEKMEAHQKGALHRAFSVFIFNKKGELLLQQRAFDKYHSAGKWSNTCCSHPRINERTQDAANRRLMEEMGLNCDLNYQFQFQYKAHFENGLIEHELDHVFFGVSDILPIINKQEVADFKYISMFDLKLAIQEEPEDFTPWFRICFDRVIEALDIK